MKLDDRIETLGILREKINPDNADLNRIIQQAVYANPWFTIEDIYKSIDAIQKEFLDPEKLKNWVRKYPLREDANEKTVGLILAGNIPLVGFHDIISVFISGHRSAIKCSEKDNRLTPYLIQLLYEINPDIREKIKIVEQLKTFDAVIATGSTNTSRYFEYYFGKYPHIIRKNRSSVGVLSGDEDEEQFELFCEDIFTYFGLGCRNLSKLYLPASVHEELIEKLINVFNHYDYLLFNPKYKANYDYNFALWTMNKSRFFQSSAVLLKEDTQIASRVASLYYETYTDLQELDALLQVHHTKIQCVVSAIPIGKWPVVAPGQAQHPSLFDYPDRVDILKFLIELADL